MNVRQKSISAGLAFAIAGSLALVPATTAQAVTQSDVEGASARLSELGAQLSSIQDELASATNDVETTDYEIGEKQSQIEQTQSDLQAKRADLSDIMRSNFKQGSTSTLDFVLGSSSIDELVSRVYYLDKVSKQHAQVISDVKSTEEKLQQEQSELTAKQDEQNQKVASLQSQADEYSSRVSEATDYFNSLDSQLQAQLAQKAREEQDSAVAAAVSAVQEKKVQEASQSQSQETSSEASAQESKQETVQEPETNKGNNEQTEETKPSTPSHSSSTSTSGGGVSTALAQIGKPYVYGATGPDSFDCSGLVCYSYGYGRGRTTYDMISSLQSTGDWKTSMDQLSYGDLIFTSEGHVGIYLGNGTMVHAPRPGASVCTTSVWSFIGGGSY